MIFCKITAYQRRLLQNFECRSFPYTRDTWNLTIIFAIGSVAEKRLNRMACLTERSAVHINLQKRSLHNARFLIIMRIRVNCLIWRLRESSNMSFKTYRSPAGYSLQGSRGNSYYTNSSPLFRIHLNIFDDWIFNELRLFIIWYRFRAFS